MSQTPSVSLLGISPELLAQAPFAKLELTEHRGPYRDFPKVEMVLIYPRLIGRNGCGGAHSSRVLQVRWHGRG